MALRNTGIVVLKLCVTCAAGLVLLLPAWLAALVQVPTATPVTVVPETVQIDAVRLLKVTGSPDEAVALRVAAPPTAKSGAVPKKRVWVWGVWAANAAVTNFAASIVSEQVDAVPLHAPPQPVKVLPVAGVAVRVTDVLPVRLAEQVPEGVPVVLVQLMPLPARVPEPVLLTVSVKVLKDGPSRTRRTTLPWSRYGVDNMRFVLSMHCPKLALSYLLVVRSINNITD